MIDWASSILPCKHDPSKLISGVVMSFDPLGNNEWTVNKTLSVEGLILLRFKLSRIQTIRFIFQVIQLSSYKVIIFLVLTILLVLWVNVSINF